MKKITLILAFFFVTGLASAQRTNLNNAFNNLRKGNIEKAKNFIHVHHVTPISKVGREYKIDPIKDLIPLCPNCHAMIHKDISLEEIQKISL